jgi:hypothetical protein
MPISVTRRPMSEPTASTHHSEAVNVAVVPIWAVYMSFSVQPLTYGDWPAAKPTPPAAMQSG